WGDYDKDGDLDLAATGRNAAGSPELRIFNNGGAGDLAQIANPAPLTGVIEGSLAWADYDADGDLDLAVSGASAGGPFTATSAGGPFTAIYRNEAGNFTLQSSGLDPLEKSSVSWGDYDNDGDNDLFLSGRNASGTPVSRLYRKNGTFTPAASTFTALSAGDAEWLDADKDGDLDLVHMGLSAAGVPSVLYYRNTDGNFTLRSNTFDNQPFGLVNGQLSVADYNNDGYPDLLFTGENAASQPETRLYRNAGNQTFEQVVVAGLPALSRGVASWGDYNNDGWMDILVAGGGASGQRFAQIWRNNGAGAFTQDAAATAALTPVDNGASAHWADYNGDGKLDILLSGSSSSGRILRLYRNDDPTPNTKPEAPRNLSWEIIGSNLKLTWDAPASTLPTKSGWSYNLFMGTSDSTSDVIYSHSLVPSGVRQVVRNGNAGYRTEWLVRGLPENKIYYWGVQSIDQDFEGSGFDTLVRVDFTPPALEDVSDLVFPGGRPAGLDQSALAWGDYDNDGDLDVAMTGLADGNVYVGEMYRNRAGQFEKDEVSSQALEDLRAGALAWADVDNDKDIDLILTGLRADQTPFSALYLNEGGVLVKEAAGLSEITAVHSSAAAWADYDKDGDYDLLLTGTSSSAAALTQLLRNEGGVLYDDTPAGLLNLTNGSVAWGDYNRDGWPDLLLTGENSEGAYTRVFRNDSIAGFTSVATDLPPVRNSSADWADVDNDGYLDFMYIGESSNTVFEPVSRLYRYNPTLLRFDRDTVPQLPDLSRGHLAFGDYDNNGWTDVVVSGQAATGPFTALYRNRGNADFQEDPLTTRDLHDLKEGSLAWGDYNNDGKLDLIFTGQNASGVRETMVYRNIDTTDNRKPGAPLNLKESVFGATVTLTWDAP
ncbi:MAG: VCBS repeat-containing protein, partial [Bacteroidetes bacterium]